jgi:predicted  nucleic acid-binding Zn-ribbon protein
MDIEIPDNEDAACDLDVLMSNLASRGEYTNAGVVSGAARRLRADAEEIARLEARLAEAETTIGALKHLIGEQEDEIAELRADLEWAIPARVMSPAEIRKARKG